MTIEIDTRTGLMKAPSASGVERLALCPGSWELEKNLPETETTDSTFGTRVHAILAGEQVEDITEEEQRTVDHLTDLRNAMFNGLKVDDQWSISLETRLTLNKGLQVLLSGQYDGLAVSPDGVTALIWDYKSLPGAVTETENNLQMRALAVLVKSNNPSVQQVIVHVLQAFTPARQPVIYQHEDLMLADQEIRSILVASMQEGAPLQSGVKQCKYCRAKTTCPALLQTMEQITAEPDLAPQNGELPKKAEVAERATLIAPDRLAEYFKRAKLATLLIEAIEEEAFRRLCLDPESIPGLAIKCDKPRVSDAETIWKRAWLNSEGMLDAKGRAKKGTAKLAEAAWAEATKDLIRTATYERQYWAEATQAAAILQAGMDEAQYRKVAGKVILASEAEAITTAEQTASTQPE
jgi:hypothetical protein